MARHVHVVTLCDMHGDEEVVATATLTLALNGKAVELDLCDDDKRRLEEAVADFAAVGRKPGSAGRTTGHTRTRVPADSQAIRAWAASNGIEIPNSRGRIPNAIRERYEREAA